MKKAFTLLFAASCMYACAQSLSPTVIASAGGFFQNGTFSNSWTFGEMTAVATVTGGSSILTQGFQQPSDISTAVTPKPVPGNNQIGVYPNPSNGQFQVSFLGASESTITFKIYDVLGQIVSDRIQKFSTGLNHTEFDLRNLRPGMYFLEASVQMNSGERYTRVTKLNITY